MALSRSHGALRPAVLPPDEQPIPPAGAAVAIDAGRDQLGRLRSSEAARALAKLPRRGAFLPRNVACNPRFKPHNQRRLEWVAGRRTELAELTGHVSRGVGAMLASAAWLYAGGELCAELAAEKCDPEMFKIAASLTSTARQHDLAAWELATREAHARTSSGGPSAHDAAAASLGEEGNAAKVIASDGRTRGATTMRASDEQDAPVRHVEAGSGNTPSTENDHAQ
jgi:hypothetical protein